MASYAFPRLRSVREKARVRRGKPRTTRINQDRLEACTRYSRVRPGSRSDFQLGSRSTRAAPLPNGRRLG